MSKKKPANKPKAKKPRKARVVQPEMPLTGVGVEITTDKILIALGDRRVEETQNISDSRTELKKIDADIFNRMHIIGQKVFRVGDRLFRDEEKHVIKVSKCKDDQAGDVAVEVTGPAPEDKTEGPI